LAHLEWPAIEQSPAPSVATLAVGKMEKRGFYRADGDGPDRKPAARSDDGARIAVRVGSVSRCWVVTSRRRCRELPRRQRFEAATTENPKTLRSTVLRRADRCARKPGLKPISAIQINNKNQYCVNSN
jgi:hypothetical protein